MSATPMSDKTFDENFKTEKMRLADIGVVMRIEAENNLSSWGEAGFQTEVEDQDSVLFVSRDLKTDKVVGFVFARLIKPEMEILNIAVLDRYKRRGMGGALLYQAINYGAEKNCEKCWLEVRETNNRARAFYQKFGFVEVGKRKNYYTNPSEDAVLFEFDFKNLPCGKTYD